jgi:DNA-directed RNA polymerase specialized sigma24 family protein
LSVLAKCGESFDETLTQWHPWLLKLSGRMARRLGLEREDVYQELAFRLIEAFPRFDSGIADFGPFSGWIARALYSRLLYREQRALHCLRWVVDDDGKEQPLVSLVADSKVAQPDEAASTADLVAVARRELNRLPRRMRNAIIRYVKRWPGKTDREALNRGIQKLRARMKVEPKVGQAV